MYRRGFMALEEAQHMTTTHAYAVASLVIFRPTGQPEQAYTVVRHLPAERGGPQYRLRSATGQERVAEEALLTEAAGPSRPESDAPPAPTARRAARSM